MREEITMRLALWLGRASIQFRENWFHITGVWLWGLDQYMEEHSVPALPTDYSSALSAEEFKQLLNELLPRTG